MSVHSGTHVDAPYHYVEDGVTIDCFSIASFWDGVPTHRILLKAGVITVEELDLRAISGGIYPLYCLPLKIVGSDGAPERCILIKED